MAAPPIVWADVIAVGGPDSTGPALRALILEHVNFALNEAIHTGPGGKQRGTFKLRRVLLAAHLAAVLTPASEEDDGTNGGLGPEYAGLITSEKVDDIERKFGGGESSSGSVSSASSDESLSSTEWGKAFLLLRPPRARLPRVL